MARAMGTLFVETAHGDMNIVDQEICTGDVYFVDSGSGNAGDTAQHGRSRQYPFATLAYAVTQVTAGQGDFILLAPGHAENVAAAAGIDCNLGNITIMGVSGHTQDMPVITFTAALSDINIDADGVKFKNIHFVNTFDTNAAPIDVNAANAHFENCIFEDDGTDTTVVWILAATAATGLTVINCVNRGTDTPGNTAWISMADVSHPRIIGNRSNGDFSAANITSTAAATDVLIDGNVLENANAVDANIVMFAASTGFITRNHCKIATDAQITWIAPANCMGGENYGVNNNGECGMITGAVSV